MDRSLQSCLRRGGVAPLERWGPLVGGVGAFVLSLFLAASVPGQSVLWCRSLGVEEGLSQNLVTAMAQDRDGFLWFGTPGGLNRWDGHAFELFPHIREQPGSLADAAVRALHVDDGGSLWIGLGAGLDRYEAATKTFHHYGSLFRNPDSGEPVPAEGIASDRGGRVWFAAFARSRVYRVDPHTGTGMEYLVPGPVGQRVTALYVDRADCLWVATQGVGGVAPPGKDAGRLVAFDRCSQIGAGDLPAASRVVPLSAEGGAVVALVEDGAGRLWLGRNGGGVARLDPRSGDLDRPVPDRSDPDTLLRDVVRGMGLSPDGELLVLTRPKDPPARTPPDRLYRVDPETLAVRRLLLRQADAGGRGQPSLERLVVDHSNTLWLSSNADGLLYADLSSDGFSLHRAGTSGSPGLDDRFVRAICLGRDGVLWVGTPRGLNRIDRSAPEAVYACPSADGGVSLPDPNVQALHEDREGNLWIGTAGGVTVVERASGTQRFFRRNDEQPGCLSDNYVLTIHESPAGTLWFGTLGKGLDRLDRPADRFTNYRDDPRDPRCLPNGTVYALYSDAEGALWVGTAAGLARFASSVDPERGLERVASDPGALGGVAVLSIAATPVVPGVLWIGTGQHGLCRLNLGNRSCRFYTTRNSDLPNDTIYGVLADPRGRLWMSSNRGLTCYDPVKDTFRSYGSQHGLQSSEFNGRAFLLGSNGEMFFGGVNGLNAFFPDRVVDNVHPPRVVVTEVHVLDRQSKRAEEASFLVYRRGMADREARVPYRQRDVTLGFVPLHYSDAGRNECVYKLEPYEKDWQGPFPQRQARYTNLDPGRYTFRVRARSSHGTWSTEDAVYSFVVLPPFYATPWFRVLAGLGVVGAIAGGHRWRTHLLRRRQRDLEGQVAERTEALRLSLAKVEEQAEKLKQLDSAKSVFFANISHEFRTPLMLTLTPLRDVQAGMHGAVPEEARAEIELAIRNTSRQLELVDQLLVLARRDAGALEFRPRNMRLDDFVRQTARSYETLARGQGIGFRVEVPDGPVSGVFDEAKLNHVMGNLLGNAFKFTPRGGQVFLRLAAEEGCWAVIRVEDTGPGIPPPELPRIFDRFYRGERMDRTVPGTGIGLAVAKECVELHQGEIWAENRPEGGSCFIVRLKTGPRPATLSAEPQDEGGRQA